MDEIIDRALRGEATREELATLAAWRRASAENERAYEQTVTLLRALERRARSVSSDARPSAPELLDRMARRQGMRGVASRRLASRWLPWGIAAAAVILAAGGSMRSRASPSASGWKPAEVVTGAADLATVQLSDGSVARLAPRSRLRLVVSDTERIVWLQGRAFFAVARQPGRPFRVRTHGGDAIALGTRFDVETETRGLRLVVVEGRVALSANGAATEVGGGHAAGLIDGRASQAVRVRDVAAEFRWMGRFLAFQSTPLRSVTEEIGRVYGLRITLADSALADQTVSAAFTDESFQQVVSVVCTVVGARCTISESSATIGR